MWNIFLTISSKVFETFGSQNNITVEYVGGKKQQTKVLMENQI